MFMKPFSEIEFDDIVSFCKVWPENVRVEYKQEIPNTIPKIVSSLANTLDGIIIFGVETDENNMPILPIEGMPSDHGIQERIVESAFTGIHPPVTPEVKFCDVPDKNGKVVVLVRVNESPEAPHAIQNSTKVYIRVDSTTQPYGEPKLADIDRIEYMLERREKLQALRDRIIGRIDSRATTCWSVNLPPVPRLTLVASPVFPYRPLISPSDIYEYIRVKQVIPFNDVAPDCGTRQVIGGVCYVMASRYQEINEHGVIYMSEKLHKRSFDVVHGQKDDEQNQYLEFRPLLENHFKLIEIAKDFYQRYDYLGEIEITATLRHVGGEKLMFGDEPHYELIQSRPSLDPEIAASIICCARDLIEPEMANDVIVNLLSQLLWGFNIRPGEWESKAFQRLDQWRQ